MGQSVNHEPAEEEGFSPRQQISTLWRERRGSAPPPNTLLKGLGAVEWPNIVCRH